MTRADSRPPPPVGAALDPLACARAVRRIVIEQSKRANVGHIGSALSIVDILVALYGGVIRAADCDDPDRNRFILSKGHGALALYAVLCAHGLIGERDLNGYCGDDTRLGVHPEHALRGVDFTTGSLVLGLSVAAGAALAAVLQGSRRRAFVLLSDAELNEGSVWEAAMFAAHHRLSNLTAIVDNNGQQAFGYTADVIDIEPMADRWRAFGWRVTEVDGHDIAQLARALDSGEPARPPRPHAIVARTVFGRGVSFMQSQICWHYLPLSDAQFAAAIDELDRGPSVEPR